MEITTTFRHMESSAAVKLYAVDRLNKLRKYFKRDPLAAHAVFSVENEHQHVAELQVTLPDGTLMQAKEATTDMYSSIDLAGARLERQVRRWKDKLRDHKPHGIAAPAGKVKTATGGAGRALDKKAGRGVAGSGGKGAGEKRERTRSRPPTAPVPIPFRVVKEDTFTARTLRLEEAVMQLNLLDAQFLAFRDGDTGTLSVIYRRRDGQYGLLDTGAKVPARSAEG